MNTNTAAPVALGPTCAACNDAAICTESGAHHTVTEFTTPDVTARLAAEDAAWEARGRMAARERVAEQVANLDDNILDAMRESAHTRRRNLVNLYIGEDRKALIEEEDLIIGVIEEEQAERAGLASSEDILAAFGL